LTKHLFSNTKQRHFNVFNTKVDKLLAHGRWFSPGTPASSTTKTGRHDIAEILLKVVLSTKNQIKSIFIYMITQFTKPGANPRLIGDMLV
jgi:hypothetical protein